MQLVSFSGAACIAKTLRAIITWTSVTRLLTKRARFQQQNHVNWKYSCSAERNFCSVNSDNPNSSVQFFMTYKSIQNPEVTSWRRPCLSCDREKISLLEFCSAYLGSPLEDKIILQGVCDSTHVKTPNWGHWWVCSCARQSTDMLIPWQLCPEAPRGPPAPGGHQDTLRELTTRTRKAKVMPACLAKQKVSETVFADEDDRKRSRNAQAKRRVVVLSVTVSESHTSQLGCSACLTRPLQCHGRRRVS